MSVWTVETWRIRNGREPHFLQHCRDLSPDSLTLFQDLEEPSLFWSPAKWETRDALDAWRKSERYSAALSLIAEDVVEHDTHLMKDLRDFPPRR